jgi:glycopeptide antibiotics resistance protein
MEKSSKREQRGATILDWPNRILILSIAGILFLTLFPFVLALHSKLPRNANPFLLQSGMKSVGTFDDFLNVLLFVPFGFGLAEKLRQRGKSRGAAFLAAFASGAMLSYGIEFLQNYIPSRDAGWHDVLTNTAGALIGFAIFELTGRAAVRVLSAAESGLDGLLTFRRAAWILPLYFVLWFVASVHLQKETRPNNWDWDCLIVVGNTVAGRPGTGWRGDIARLELWNHALPDDFAAKLTSGDIKAADSSDPAAAYQLIGAAPFRDEKGLLADLSWKANAPQAASSNAISMDGKNWLSSAVPASELTKEIGESKQFSVRVICTPADVVGIDKRLVSLSRASGVVDLDLRQDDANLVFWFRNLISVRHAQLAWYIPGVFVPGQTRDILFSYDGANLTLHVNGHKEGRKYVLGPGTSLARMLRKVKPSELEAYRDVYYALLFFPAGIILGMVFRKLDAASAYSYLFLGSCLLFPPVVLEIIIIHVSGRNRSVGTIVMALCLAMAGSLWINADRHEGVERNGHRES